jgi:uncharacterized protein YggE
MSAEALVHPDVIEVVVTHEEELAASHAFLQVSVKGSSLVTGDAALSKAREVSALVAALAAQGVPQADIRVENIQAEVSSGLLTKSSSATYTLRVRCDKLEGLADVLGAITSQKNATLNAIDWGYPEDDARRTGWLVACAEVANVRARAIAEALGVKLLGVHRFGEPVVEGFAQVPGALGGAGYPKSAGLLRARGMTSEDLGLAIAHMKQIEVRVTVQYRVSAFG